MRRVTTLLFWGAWLVACVGAYYFLGVQGVISTLGLLAALLAGLFVFHAKMLRDFPEVRGGPREPG